MPQPARRTLKRFLTLSLIAASIAGFPSAMRTVSRYLHGDAFARMRRNETNTTGIRLEGVHFRHYSGNRLLTFAQADRIDVSRDRSIMDMQGIHEGTYRDGDRTFKYLAKHAQWQANARVLNVGGLVRIQNADLDLQTAGATFDATKRTLEVGGEVKGRLAKGTITAKKLHYSSETEAYSTGPIEWQGLLAANLTQDEEKTDRRWHVTAEETEYSGKQTDIAKYKNAVATDGEIFVVAPSITHNRKTDVLVATGRVQYFSAKANMVADQADVYRRDKRAVFSGHVVMLVKPKTDQSEKPKIEAIPQFQPLRPDQVKADPPKGRLPKEQKDKVEELRNAKSVRDYPLIMSSERIEYWYARGSRRAVITGDPQGRQELTESRWRHLWSNVGYYDGEKEVLRLVSTKGKKDTRLKDSVGDDAVADWFLLSTKEDEDAFTGGGIVGDFTSVDDEDDPRNPPPPGQSPPPTNPSKPPPVRRI